MKKAREVLKDCRPEVPDSAHFYAGRRGNSSFERQEALELQHLTSNPDPRNYNAPLHPRADGTEDVDVGMMEGVEQMAEEIAQQQELAVGHNGYFNQDQVVEGGTFGEVEDPKAQGAAVCFRVSWLQFLEGISHAYDQERNLLDFIVGTGFCPLCPFGQSGAFAPTAAKEQVGLFGNFAGKHQSTAHLHSNPWQHLAIYHPSELTALQCGRQLNPGVLQSPLVPLHTPDIHFQADPELAARFLTPTSLPGYFDGMSNAQKIVIAKHSKPTLYVDPNNQSQVDWADKAVGKLLKSTLKGKPGEREG